MEIKNSEDLKAAILELEDRKQREKAQLVESFHAFTHSLTPANLIKNTFKGIKETPGIRGTVLKASLGLGAGLLSRKLLWGKSPGFFRKIMASAIEMGVATLVTRKTDTIKSRGTRFLKNIFTWGKKNGVH